MNLRYYYFLLVIFLTGCLQPGSSFVSLENRVSAIEIANVKQYKIQKESVENNDLNLMELREEIKILSTKIKPQENQRKEYADVKYDIEENRKNIQQIEEMFQIVDDKGVKTYTSKEYVQIKKRVNQIGGAVSFNHKRLLKLEEYMGLSPSVFDQENKQPHSSVESTQQEDFLSKDSQVHKTTESVKQIEQIPEETEQSLYDLAKELFDKGENSKARAKFERFIKEYPESDKSDNASFWIADTYYDEKWFEKAIIEYQKVIENYPYSNKLVAAKLKQGYAFAELGEKANAKLILNELLKQHPDSEEVEYAKEKLKHLK